MVWRIVRCAHLRMSSVAGILISSHTLLLSDGPHTMYPMGPAGKYLPKKKSHGVEQERKKQSESFNHEVESHP